MKITIPTSPDDRTPMAVTVSDVCPVPGCGAERMRHPTYMHWYDNVSTTCEHSDLDSWEWLRKETSGDPLFQEYVALFAAPLPTFTAPDDSIPFDGAVDPAVFDDETPYREGIW